MGLEDGVLQREPKVDLAAEAPRLHELQSARRAATAAAEKDRALEHVANVSANPESIRHANGLIVEPLKSGAGDMPSSTDHVSVHYVGRLVDGTVFDSSLARGEPATFPVKGVIACWNQALPTLRVGTRARLTCPPELAYGDRGLPPTIRPGATLIFELELLGIIR
jgi:FKBP-type peptidyl-prolyl cis-trans isomerase FkpA/FKBP-type peptidyl-prolyl cis-trans isomerase FklB